MTQWLMGRVRRRRSAPWPRSDSAILAAMPDYLLYDIGVSRDGIPSLARQIRCEGEGR